MAKRRLHSAEFKAKVAVAAEPSDGKIVCIPESSAAKESLQRCLNINAASFQGRFPSARLVNYIITQIRVAKSKAGARILRRELEA